MAILTGTAAVGCGLVAGLFLAFSVAIMPALWRLPAATGAQVMQTVNVVIVNPPFLLLFAGTAVACIGVAVTSLVTAGGDVARVGGAALYVLGTFGVTAVVNVPLNNALATLDPADADGAASWRRYRSRWTAWNHVRALAAAAAAVLLILAPPG